MHSRCKIEWRCPQLHESALHHRVRHGQTPKRDCNADTPLIVDIHVPAFVEVNGLWVEYSRVRSRNNVLRRHVAAGVQWKHGYLTNSAAGSRLLRDVQVGRHIGLGAPSRSVGGRSCTYETRDSERKSATEHPQPPAGSWA